MRLCCKESELGSQHFYSIFIAFGYWNSNEIFHINPFCIFRYTQDDKNKIYSFKVMALCPLFVCIISYTNTIFFIENNQAYIIILTGLPLIYIFNILLTLYVNITMGIINRQLRSQWRNWLWNWNLQNTLKFL